MKTIWKKISVGLLAFALVFSTIPPMGASADTIDPGTDTGEKEECVFDVSTAEHFSLPMQGVDYVYVLTGENTSADIYITGDCDIILRNTTLNRIYTNYAAPYTVNITLEGENSINQAESASEGALEVYSSNITINGDEDDSLLAKSRAFCCYSSNGDAGGITVNGGNITFEGESASALATTYTQNGGTVKTISADGSSFRYALNLNGGTLEVNHQANNSVIFNNPVKIKNGASMKVTGPETPGQNFSFNGPLGLADGAAADDCLLVRFDDSSDFVYLDEGNEILRGKTYAEIKAVTHVHEYENGICSCNYSCVHNTDDGTCSLCEAYIYKIKHQPTVEEPYVALNDGTGASYQWYEVKNISEITDESKIYPWSYFGAPFEEDSTYDTAAGWTPIDDSYEGNSYKYLYYIASSFKAGDQVTLRFSSPVEYAGIFNQDDELLCELDGTVATATIPSDGVYGIFTMTKSTEPTVKVYVGDAEVNALTGQTSATLSQYAYGNYYYCKATAKNGTVLTSDYADFTYKITHQPTDEAQYVSVNDSEGASYQWYVAKEDIVPVTEENSHGWSVFDAPEEIGGTYDNETGWTPDEEGYYFVVWLDEGDVVNFEFSQTPSELEYLFSTTEGTVEDVSNIESDTSLTAEASGYYGIYAANGGNLKATMDGTEFIAVSGQTDATLNASELGRYRCEVTFGNGTKKTSDVVEILHLHAGGTATCNDKAICTTCGIGYGSTLPHTVVATEVTKAATTSQNGTVVEKCTCGATVNKLTIPKISNVSLSKTAYTYNGEKKTPSVTVYDAQGNKLVKDTDYTVKYSSTSRKKIGRYYATVTFKGNYSGSTKLYFTIGPKNPSTVKAYLYGHDDVKVTWSKVSGASGYRVYYKKSGASSYTYLKTTTGTSYKKSNLADGTKYYFKVVAYKTVSGNKCLNEGKAKSVYTLKKVTGVKAAKSSSKVKISWTNIAGESGYQISKSTSKSKTGTITTYKTTKGKSKTISATKGKTYYYKVRAYKTVGDKKIYGPWSSVVKYKRS